MKRKREETYKQAKMVNWYHPRMLLNTGIKAVISGTFGNYADRRELQAALDDNQNEAAWLALQEEYCGKNGEKEDIWIDVVNDTGDGFNATFAIAKCVAKKELKLTLKKKDGTTESITAPRAKILIFGGDEVYPFPTLDDYTDKFKIPFASAAEDRIERDKEEDRPHMYAIPGNHDWYDGLGNFIKLFCQGRWIGIWSTKQHRSYFALPLPQGYWIWATDIQLNSDIDAPQLQYFKSIAENKMKRGDKVILITAEPAWVFNEILAKDRSFNKLKFFVDNYIVCKGKNSPFKHAATLTGDLHHYSRYHKEGSEHGHQYITAGGGGAFLHETHSLPECLRGIGKSDIFLRSTFPDQKKSRGLMWWNFAFPWLNRLFTGLLIAVYIIFFALLRGNDRAYFPRIGEHLDSVSAFLSYTLNMLLHSPATLLATAGLGFGFYAFADTKIKNSWSRLAGALHGIAHVLLLYSAVYLFSRVAYCEDNTYGYWGKMLWMLGISIFWGILAAFLFGCYLFLSNRLLGMHINEASSSFACEDFKNFLRLHIHKDGVTIYPIGIRRVPRHWKTVPEKGDLSKPSDRRYAFAGPEEPEAILIEEPIQIHNDKL